MYGCITFFFRFVLKKLCCFQQFVCKIYTCYWTSFGISSKFLIEYVVIRLCSHSVLVWYIVLQFEMASGKYLCHFLRSSPENTFSDNFIVAFVLSKTPILFAGLMVAWRTVILTISAISFITFVTKTEPLFVVIFVGWYACLVIMAMITFAVLAAEGLDIVHAKA